MDNPESFLFDDLLDKYIEENAKFHVGQVVYMEYSYTHNNQTKLGLTIGIVKNVTVTSVKRKVGDNIYTDYPIVYSVVHPKGLANNVFENKLASVSEYILKERMKQKAKKVIKNER